MSRHHDLMRDPYFAQLMFHLEYFLHEADTRCDGAGITLTDTQVNSLVSKGISFFRGKRPKPPKASDGRSQILRETFEAIAGSSGALRLGDPDTGELSDTVVPDRDLCRALLAIRESINIRRSPVEGGRAYLDFLREFVADAKSQGKP